jgi:acyl-[acyl-carrier-protein]-phospholipid O-acyltransferase / long-chain-fatty-acid--[acyl-carrier-protein] ligase
VPTFAAVQAWAGADRRARVIAGVNVLNAAFMVAGTIVIALMQAFGATTPLLFIVIGVSTLVVASRSPRPCRVNPLMDFLSIVFRALYRVEVKGVENLLKAGPNPIIALNHVSFLDAALALSLLPTIRCSRSTRHGAELVGQAVPALHPRHAARSDQADGDAHADQRGQGRRDR